MTKLTINARWSEEPPHEPGIYLRRIGKRVAVVQVTDVGGTLFANGIISSEEPERIGKLNDESLWAGPFKDLSFQIE